ncbi:MAG: dihydrolipoyl dehydrogenase [Oligoflexales bacterium]|nr:dihydrolipoyl dehydrogenase [Oligoflexales bacterium]
MTESNFELVIIGGGPGGYVCAIKAAQLGLKVACIENRGALGGTCLNVGCIPSKALLESSHLYHQTKSDLADHGVVVKQVQLDLLKMQERRQSVVSSLTKGIEGLFKKNKVTYLKGTGSFISKNQIRVVAQDGSEQIVNSEKIVIATGSSPIELASAKFDGKTIVSSTEALEFDKVPSKLVIIGGGVIGLELGSVWSRLGSEVIVIEALPQILAGMDGAVRTLAARLFEKQGMKILANTMLEKVELKKGGGAKVICKKSEEKIEIECEKILVAVGRRAFTAGLNLETVGIKTNQRGQVEVDADFGTSVPGIYAIGDVIHGPMLAHKAEEEGATLAEKLAGQKAHVNYRSIPNVVYTHPEIASVGLSEEACKEQGLAIKMGKFPFSANGRAKAAAQTEGFVKVIADANSDKILGIHIIGQNASELIAEAALAFEYEASAEDLARTVHAHPTLAEAIKEAAMDVSKHAIHF